MKFHSNVTLRHDAFLFQDCCGDDFKLELDKWNLDPDLISDCCCLQYRRSVSVRHEREVRGEGRYAAADGEEEGGETSGSGWRNTVWEVLENTDPRWYTKVRCISRLLVELPFSLSPRFLYPI